jgi:DnaJ-class molecular chaperone
MPRKELLTSQCGGSSVNAGTQTSILQLWPCDICKGSRVETDPETLRERPCRVCQGTGILDYEPPSGGDPFEGMEA